jgi:hypothetical protein
MGPTASDATQSPRWFVIVVNNPLTSYFRSRSGVGGWLAGNGSVAAVSQGQRSAAPLGVGSLRRRDRSMIGPDAKELAQHRSWPLSPLCTRRFASASSARTFRDPESVVRAPAHVQQAAPTVPEIAGMRECVAKATRIGDCCTRGLGVVSLHWPTLSAPQRARIIRAHLYQCIRGWSRCSHGIANRRPRRQYQCHQRPPRRRRQGSPRARLLSQSSVLT